MTTDTQDKNTNDRIVLMRQIGQLRTGKRFRIVGSATAVVKNNDATKFEMIESSNDMDSMADTSCAGSNWVLVDKTGYTCDVFPFKDGMDPVRNVPIATCATLVQPENGSPFIVIGNEMLYFGDQLQRSLLNQNQIRHHISKDGGTVQDDYTREEPFGITVHDRFIPFTLQASAITFKSRTPTPKEIEDLPHVVITSEKPWGDFLSEEQPTRIGHVRTSHVYDEAVPRQYDTDVILSSVSPIFSPEENRVLTIASVNVGPRCISAVATERHSIHSPETLSRLWNVGIETAKRTMRATTQKGIRQALHPIFRRYRTDHIHLHRNRLNDIWYFDHSPSKFVSLNGNDGVHVITNGSFTKAIPQPSKKYTGKSLRLFSHDIGIPDRLITDLAGEHTGRHTEFMRQIKHLDIDIHYSEKGRHKQNHKAEREIGILKQRWRTIKSQRNIPERLWDYFFEHDAEILSRMAKNNDSRSGFEMVTGNTPDISEWLDFGFYDLVWYHNSTAHSTNDDIKSLGRWLGVSHRVGSDMCYKILSESGTHEIHSTTVQHVTATDRLKPEIQRQITAFENAIHERLVANQDAHQIAHDPTTEYLQDEYSVRTGTP